MTHLIKRLPAAAVFSVVQQYATQVPKASVKDGLNGETDKAKSLSLPAQYLQMAILGPMLLSRSNRRTLSYRNKAIVRTQIGTQRQRSIPLLLTVLGVLDQRDKAPPRDLEHLLVACFQNNHPMELPNNSQALQVHLLRLHIRLRSHQTEWALRDIPRRLVKQYHQRRYQLHPSTRQRMPGHAPAPPLEERKTDQYLTFSTCPTMLCR